MFVLQILVLHHLQKGEKQAYKTRCSLNNDTVSSKTQSLKDTVMFHVACQAVILADGCNCLSLSSVINAGVNHSTPFQCHWLELLPLTVPPCTPQLQLHINMTSEWLGRFRLKGCYSSLIYRPYSTPEGLWNVNQQRSWPRWWTIPLRRSVSILVHL